MQIKFLKKQFNFKKVFTLNKLFYWKFLVYLGFVLIIVSFFIGFIIFKDVNKEIKLSDENIAPQVETVKKERIKKALLYFSERVKKSEEILNSRSPIIDPSL